MRGKVSSVFVLIVLLSTAIPMGAHQSFAAEFDKN
jgi:hypothetical protein